MEEIEGPAAVLVAALEDDVDGLADAMIGLDAGITKII